MENVKKVSKKDFIENFNEITKEINNAQTPLIIKLDNGAELLLTPWDRVDTELLTEKQYAIYKTLTPVIDGLSKEG